nr:MAG TPA: hypothetical protein [Caudoviricetes sp.]
MSRLIPDLTKFSTLMGGGTSWHRNILRWY